MCTHQDDQSQNKLPCLHCQPHLYIRMVQHMIERCIIHRMTRDECVKALDRHASILPLVTLTDIENEEFEEKIVKRNSDHVVNVFDTQYGILGLLKFAKFMELNVWRGLQRENKNFFETYGHVVSRRPFLSGYVRRSPRFARRRTQRRLALGL